MKSYFVPEMNRNISSHPYLYFHAKYSSLEKKCTMFLILKQNNILKVLVSITHSQRYVRKGTQENYFGLVVIFFSQCMVLF